MHGTKIWIGGGDCSIRVRIETYGCCYRGTNIERSWNYGMGPWRRSVILTVIFYSERTCGSDGTDIGTTFCLGCSGLILERSWDGNKHSASRVSIG